jgi:hypothetical protein
MKAAGYLAMSDCSRVVAGAQRLFESFSYEEEND